ncbi:MAG TPA: helix-turn-helix domain-containing protein [Gaiellaceae bacterium]|nr:helix-turn-helix domain-containing protein [Gaiellaceae bacterium]
MIKTTPTPQRLIEAALETLKTAGFAGATSRAIARAADVNQALVFYYFGSLDGLLLAALDATSEARLERYREGVESAESVDDLVALAGELYEEDRRAGHITVVAQMVAGSLARPELAPEVLARMEPWLALCREAFEKVDGGATLPARELAVAAVTFYLGLNLLTHLDPERARQMFEGLLAVAPLPR